MENVSSEEGAELGGIEKDRGVESEKEREAAGDEKDQGRR